MTRRKSMQRSQPAVPPQKISAAKPDEAKKTRSAQLTRRCRSGGGKSIELQLGNPVDLQSNVQHPHSGLSRVEMSAARVRDLAAIVAAIAKRRDRPDSPTCRAKELEP